MKNKAQKAEKVFKLSVAALLLTLALVVTVFTVATDNAYSWSNIFSFFGVAEEQRDSYVRFMNVGQGDCTLIYSDGRAALIDCGGEDYQLRLCKKLKTLGIEKLDIVILSHFDTDHAGALGALYEEFGIASLIIPDHQKSSSDTFPVEKVSSAVLESGGKVHTASVGSKFGLGDIDLEIIAYYPDEKNENNRSVAVTATLDGKSFLFTGDGVKDFELRLLTDNPNIDCDVYKAAHHGDKKGSSEKLLNRIKPDYCIVSCSEDNYYGHPHKETLSRFLSVNAEILTTYKSGDITFYTENGKLLFDTEKN